MISLILAGDGRGGGLSGRRSVGGCGFSSPYNQARRKSVITFDIQRTVQRDIFL